MMNLIRRLLALDENDRQIRVIQDKAQREIKKATVLLAERGELQTLVIEKTTTYYMAKAMGIIKETKAAQ